jgi:hypothetical protein
MTSNGSEALNSVFRVERTLSVAAIMEVNDINVLNGSIRGK